MSKGAKRVKSGTAQAGGVSKWETGLVTAPFEEDDWKASVTFVVGNRPEDYQYINILSSTVASGTRKLFSVISKEELYPQVKEFGNPKAKKPKEVPAFYEVCEPCKNYVDTGEDIPVPLLSKLLKFKLLAIKAADIKRRETEKKGGGDKDKGKKDKGRERSKSPAKKGGKKTPEPPSAKEGSKLKKRGDEDQENKYIDDEPDDGPQHYILIQGFNSSQLLPLLSELGINVNAIIKVRSQDYSRFDEKAETEETTEKEKDEKTLAAEEAAKQEKSYLKKELNKFWKEILPLLQKQPQTSKLHDVARLEYEIKNILIPQNIEDNEQKSSFGSAIFEDVACMIYDLLDAKRLYHTYIENLKLLHVPQYGQPIPPADGASAVSAPTPAPAAPPAGSALSLAPVDGVIEGHVQADMRYYNDLMNCVPQESVSVPLILHCMLEQVVASEEQRDPPSEIPPPPRPDGLNNDLASFISGMTFKLALTEDEHKQLTNCFDLPERPPDTPKQPLLMNFQDNTTHRLHHLKTINGFNPIEVEKDMLTKLSFTKFFDLPRIKTTESRERASRLQELLHFCATGGLSQSEIDRAFKQFVFECIDLSATDPNGFILTRLGEGIEHSAIPWDDPYPYYKGMIPHHERSAAPDISLDDSQSGSNDVIKFAPDEPLPRTPPPVHFAITPEILDDNSERSSRSKQKDKIKNSGGLSPIIRDSRSPALHERSASASSQASSPDRSRPSTADSKKGILRQSRSNSPIKPGRSRSNSVHFEKIQDDTTPVDDDNDGDDKEEQGQEIKTEDLMNEVVDAQKRILDQWCFAEHFEPNVLLQVLQEASYNLPFMETYYHKRDHSLMVVLHNPYNTELLNHVDWHEELHSNLGFRNYLENVAESISDWLKEEDAKYQAQFLARELEKMRQAEDAQAKSQEKSSKARSKSPKKSPSRSKSPKSGSRAGSSERPSSASSNPFIRSGSLKAWKDEQDRLKEEEEEKERQKSAKRTKSPKKQQEDKDKDKKASSRNSAKSKGSHPVVEPEPTTDEIQPAEPEKYWPFTGYDVGNDLLHVSGIVTSLFPSDGGQIRTERTEYIQSTTAVKTTVMKDGHVFTIHILNPKEAGEENELNETQESILQSEKTDLDESLRGSQDLDETKTSKPIEEKPSVSGFGSITGLFSDGMTLALSQFGPSGSVDKEKPAEEECDQPQAESPVPQTQQQQQQTSPRKEKKGEKGKEKAPPTPEPPQPPPEDEQVVEEKDEESFPTQPFQQLFVTCPDGLNISYYLESSIGIKPVTDEDRRILVKQSYPFKTKGEQDCESVRKKFALSEQSRVTTSDGTVIKNMLDGTVQVLHADGTVAVHSGPWPLSQSRSSSPNRTGTPKSSAVGTDSPIRKARPGKLGGKNLTIEKTEQRSSDTEKCGTWTITYPQGERFSFTTDGVEDLKPVMISLASDPETRQSMSTRDDHVITVSFPDGTTIVEHADGTRMTTYYRDTQVPIDGDDSLETGEEPRYENETVKFVKVECPGYATLEFNCLSSENLTIFGNGSTINVFPDGYYMMHHSGGGRMEIDTEGTMIYFPRPNKSMEQILPERAVQYVLRHNADVVCETVDPEGNVFNVKYNGDYTVQTANGEEASSVVSGDSQIKVEKKIVSYKQHSPRFFIIHTNGSGTELLRYQDVAEYLMTAEQSPATAILRDSLADCPGVTGITILKPYIGGPSERWLKKYDLESIIPAGIRSRDLTNIPSREYKKPGPGFGTSAGQGLCVGAAVKVPQRIPILKCPDLLELRQLVQYRPVSSDLRNSLNSGLQDYAKYFKSRMAASDLMQITDPRSDEERRQAMILQNLAFSQQQELEPAIVREKYEDATAPPIPTPPPTPQPKRTTADWERDRRELEEEREARDALRNKKVPKYFDSEFGKAFLLTQAKDMDEMMKHISEDPRQDGTEAIRADSSTPGYPRDSGSPSSNHPDVAKSENGPVVISAASDATLTSTETPPFTQNTKVISETPVSNYAGFVSEATPSGVRPGNPTPGHATGQGSPAPVRPKNPTPAHAMKSVPERPGNPTPKQAGGTTDSLSDHTSKELVNIVSQPIVEEDYCGDMMIGDSDLILTRSLKVDVFGHPRKEEVSLPSSIKGGRPGAFPNSRFQQVEDPVRRKVNNTIVTGGTPQGQRRIISMRGLMLFPEEVDFGVLKEGNTYGYTVNLKNTGVDSCRYKVRQPPPATGLRVYYKPGPVAAGLNAELVLELYAIAVGVEGNAGIGSVRHDIEIITETDILYLPVSAVVLTAHEYDNRNSSSPQGKKSPGVRLVSRKPPASSGIIRPRREPTTGSSTIKVQ